MDALAGTDASITELGFTVPVLIADGKIIIGHSRLKAPEELKLAKVPALRLDHLTPEQLHVYAIADNQLVQLSFSRCIQLVWTHSVLGARDNATGGGADEMNRIKVAKHG